MNIKKLILEAIESGATERDANGNVSFELFGTKHSVRVTDSDVEKYQAELDAELEQAEQDLVEAEAAITTAKAKIESAAKRKGKKKKKKK